MGLMKAKVNSFIFNLKRLLIALPLALLAMLVDWFFISESEYGVLLFVLGFILRVITIYIFLTLANLFFFKSKTE